MAINKVVFGGETVIDLTSDTVTADKLMKGVTAHSKSGAKITGSFSLDSELSTQGSLIPQIQTALQDKAAGPDPVLQTKTVTPTTSQQNVAPDSGYDGLSKVTVNAIPSDYMVEDELATQGNLITRIQTTLQTKASGITPTGTINITENGTYDVTQYASANVEVASSGGGGSGTLSTGTITVRQNKSGKYFSLPNEGNILLIVETGTTNLRFVLLKTSDEFSWEMLYSYDTGAFFDGTTVYLSNTSASSFDYYQK